MRHGTHAGMQGKLNMYRTSKETALLLALILKRSEQTRARLSTKTIKFISRRINLRGAFVVALADALVEYGWNMSELDTGGFGVIQTKSLEAAKAVTARRYLSDDELRAVRRDVFDATQWIEEAQPEQDEPDENE